MADDKNKILFRCPPALWVRLQKICEKQPGEKGWTKQDVLLRALMHELPLIEQEMADQPYRRRPDAAILAERDRNNAVMAKRAAYRKRKAKP